MTTAPITTYEERVRELEEEEGLTTSDAQSVVDVAGNCPKCGSYQICKRRAFAWPEGNAACDTDWTECETCDHQWGHQ